MKSHENSFKISTVLSLSLAQANSWVKHTRFREISQNSEHPSLCSTSRTERFKPPANFSAFRRKKTTKKFNAG